MKVNDIGLEDMATYICIPQRHIPHFTVPDGDKVMYLFTLKSVLFQTSILGKLSP